MPVRYLSDPELARLSTWPGEITDEDAAIFFTLSDADRSWVRGFNGADVAGERKVTVRSAAGAGPGKFRLRHACGLYAQRAAPAHC